MHNLKDLMAEIHVFTSCLRGFDVLDFVGWLSQRQSIQGLTVRDVYYMCLNRLPEEPSAATLGYATSADCAAHIVECIGSEEFRRRLPELMFAALPELKRHFFVHIPRTGGTSLRNLTEQHHAVLSWNESYVDNQWFAWQVPGAGPAGERFMLRFLAQFGRSDPPAFYYTGHFTLPSLLTRSLIRPRDEIVAVLREPVEIVESTVNYIFTIASGEVRSPDALDWTGWIQSIDNGWVPGAKPSAELIEGLLRSDRFQRDYSDLMTRYLSLDGTVQGALDGIMISQCRVIWVDEIDSYARDVLGIAQPVARENASRDIMGEAAALSPAARTYMRKVLCAKDRELVTHLSRSQLLQSVARRASAHRGRAADAGSTGDSSGSPPSRRAPL